jgi:hypothetical protein
MSCCRSRAGLRQTGSVSADDPWAPLAERFVDGHHATLRGRVRNYVIACHLFGTICQSRQRHWSMWEVGRVISPFPSPGMATR